jgi:hypothetical protein
MGDFCGESQCSQVISSAPQYRDTVCVVGNANVLGFHVEIEAVIATIAANTTHFSTTERRGQITVVFRIDPQHAGFDLVGDA